MHYRGHKEQFNNVAIAQKDVIQFSPFYGGSSWCLVTTKKKWQKETSVIRYIHLDAIISGGRKENEEES